MDGAVPWSAIEAVFLDVGNTVVGIDVELVAARLAPLGVRVEAEAVLRAEARARPALSRALAAGEDARRGDFLLYLELILAHLPAGSAPAPSERREAIAAELGPTLREPGASDQLWNRPLPGAREALDRLRSLGLPVIAVSNSDGTAARSLERAGLRDGFDAVVDSHVIGAAKPARAIFEAALAHVPSIARERIVHVGDILDVDVVGARGAGLHAVLLDPFDDWTATAGVERCRDVGVVAERLAQD